MRLLHLILLTLSLSLGGCAFFEKHFGDGESKCAQSKCAEKCCGEKKDCKGGQCELKNKTCKSCKHKDCKSCKGTAKHDCEGKCKEKTCPIKTDKKKKKGA